MTSALVLECLTVLCLRAGLRRYRTWSARADHGANDPRNLFASMAYFGLAVTLTHFALPAIAAHL